MQFITLDQRIAVENFEVGIVYIVTFTNGDSFTGSCIGIGVDFVAFQRTAPELLFCLTMAAAADVASIDPLGSDIGKILEYTGSVPVSIKTNGSPLLDYLITGNTTQSDTPTPENPVIPQGCGELETVGAKAGQYKIPISSASTTTPVYLGEVETTSKIYKQIITGNENTWRMTGSGRMAVRVTIGNTIPDNASCYCSHFKGTSISSYSLLNDGECSAQMTGTGGYREIGFYDSTYTSVDDFKTYLQQQYAAGTPVCVWYVLAEPTTGIVNEPLMRIGDYADTLSYRQSGINVPTTDGLNIFDIDTTVKPSEVYLKYFSPLF